MEANGASIIVIDIHTICVVVRALLDTEGHMAKLRIGVSITIVLDLLGALLARLLVADWCQASSIEVFLWVTTVGRQRAFAKWAARSHLAATALLRRRDLSNPVWPVFSLGRNGADWRS